MASLLVVLLPLSRNFLLDLNRRAAFRLAEDQAFILKVVDDDGVALLELTLQDLDR